MSLFKGRLCPNFDRDRAFPEPPQDEHECEGCGVFIPAPGLCYPCWQANQLREEKDDA